MSLLYVPQSKSVDDEAAMKFAVRFSSGREFETEPMYFGSGTKVIVTITSDGVEVHYDHER